MKLIAEWNGESYVRASGCRKGGSSERNICFARREPFSTGCVGTPSTGASPTCGRPLNFSVAKRSVSAERCHSTTSGQLKSAPEHACCCPPHASNCDDFLESRARQLQWLVLRQVSRSGIRAEEEPSSILELTAIRSWKAMGHSGKQWATKERLLRITFSAELRGARTMVTNAPHHRSWLGPQ